MNKKMNGYKNILTVLLALLILGMVAGPGSAAADITIANASITSSNTVVVNFNEHAGNLLAVEQTKWHIDVGNNGGNPLNPTGVALTSYTSPYIITLTFLGTPFSDTNKTYSAAEGLYVDDIGVETSSSTNVIVTHDVSKEIADGQSPTIALTYGANPAKAGAMTITATYSEAIVGTPKISINQPGTADITTQDMADSGNQTVWTYAYTVNTTTGGTYLDGNATVSLSTVADVATNNASSPTGTNFTIDTTAPTVSLTYSANPAKAGAMTITATYSEAIVGTPAISVDQPSYADITTQDMADSGNQTVWTYVYTVNTTTGGTYLDGNANVSLSTVADVATNNAGSPTGTNFTIDTTAPTVALTYSANPAKTGAMTITATYSEAIVGTPKISINQPGTADISTQDMADCGNQTVWTYAYTVNTTTGGTYLDGNATVSLSAVADGATNNASSPTGTNFTIDTTAPTVALTYSANPAKAGAMTITATYSEAIVGTPKISINQPGTADLITQDMADGGNQTVWTYAYTVNTTTGGTYLDGNTTVSLSTVADGATNNASSQTGTNFTIDTTAPTVALTYSANPAKAGAMTITATYSEAIVGTPAISINQPGTNDINTQAMNGGPTAWNYAYTVNTATGGTYVDGTATVSLSTVADGATNNASSPTGTTFTIDTTTPTEPTQPAEPAEPAVDTTAPTVALTYSANPAKAGPMTITATYSEPIVGTPKISIDQPGTTDITAQAMSGGVTVWTYAYTVNTATGETFVDGASTVSLSTVSDGATNNAESPTGTTFAIDTTAPNFTAVRTAPNSIVLTFPENVDVTTTDGQGYTLSSGTVTANTDPAGSGNTITLTTSGVSGSPTVTYGAAAGTTVDTAANEVADGFSAVSLSGSAAASIVVTANNITPLVNVTVTLNATVKDSSGITSGYLGTGNISFLANGTEFASAILSSGVASTTYTRATSGAVTITALYNSTLQNTTTVTFTQAVLPALTVSAKSTAVIIGMPTSVIFNVTSSGSAKANATVTLSGVATGNSTTNASGLAIIIVNATSSGTITATAKMSGYNDGTINITAEETAIVHGNDTIGLFRNVSGGGVFFLRNGISTTTTGYGFGNDTPISGDWNGDYTTKVGTFRNINGGGVFFLRNNATSTTTTGYGFGNDTPVSGDWNGDSITEVGVFRNVSGGGVFFLSDGTSTTTIGYGFGSDIPVSGDWNGDATTEVGVFRNVSGGGVFFLNNGTITTTIGYGSGNDTPVVGDWNGDGTTEVGVYRNGVFFLRDGTGNTTTLGYGLPNDEPVTGNWAGH